MSKNKKDYYSILEVEYDATQQRIKEMYYYLAKIYHPDINPRTGNLFNEISIAYEVLSDPNKRKAYDLANNIGSYVILDKIKTQGSYETIEGIDNFPRNLEELYFKFYNKKISLDTLQNKILKNLDVKNEFTLQLTQDYISTHYQEDKFKEDPYDPDIDFPFNWFTEHSYYNDPKNQPIFEILHNFQNYKFENSIHDIFKRNVLAIFGVWLTYFIGLFYIIRNKIFKKYYPTVNDIKKEHKYKWYTYLLNIQAKNRFWRTFCITNMMFVLGVSKIIFVFLKSIYWIFDRIIKYFLLPLALVIKYVLFGAFIWTLRIYGIKK